MYLADYVLLQSCYKRIKNEPWALEFYSVFVAQEILFNVLAPLSLKIHFDDVYTT